MSREKRKAKALAREVRRQRVLMSKGEGIVAAALDYAEKADRRSDVWRNLLCASAFARGLGNERPIIEVVAECHPELLGGVA